MNAAVCSHAADLLMPIQTARCVASSPQPGAAPAAEPKSERQNNDGVAGKVRLPCAGICLSLLSRSLHQFVRVDEQKCVFMICVRKPHVFPTGNAVSSCLALSTLAHTCRRLHATRLVGALPLAASGVLSAASAAASTSSFLVQRAHFTSVRARPSSGGKSVLREHHVMDYEVRLRRRRRTIIDILR